MVATSNIAIASLADLGDELYVAVDTSLSSVDHPDRTSQLIDLHR